MSAQTKDQFLLRLPDGMRDQLKADALINDRSMNAEIIARLSGTQANLRDKIAIAALPAIIAATSAGQHRSVAKDSDTHIAFAIARDAYFMADAMLAVRSEAS